MQQAPPDAGLHVAPSVPASGATAVRVCDLRKTFRVPRHRVHTMKERALHPLRRTGFDEFRVLRGLSFEVGGGEFFGIVGRNGSGKSTLLKCLAGIYRTDGGTIEVRGRLSPFIELGVGFNPDLTARDNVLINAVMMGLSPRGARERFDDIISFAELERFVDQKLKNYSSGMQVRLAFAVMVQSDPEVMLIDEVLAVGDAAFQQKCIDVFYRLRGEGKTIILVTHEMGLVERFCHRAMMLTAGEIATIGDPAEVGREYLRENFATYAGERYDGGASDEVRILTTEILDERLERIDAAAYGRRIRLRVVLEARTEISRPGISLWLTNEDGVRIATFGARENGEGLADLAPGHVLEYVVDFDNPLSAGRYHLGCGVTRGSAGLEILLYQERAVDIVSFGENLHGVVAIEHSAAVHRGPLAGVQS